MKTVTRPDAAQVVFLLNELAFYCLSAGGICTRQTLATVSRVHPTDTIDRLAIMLESVDTESVANSLT